MNFKTVVLLLLGLFIVSCINDEKTLSLSEKNLVIPYEGGDISLDISLGSNWRIANSTDWISVSSNEGYGSETIDITVEGNLAEERNTTIEVTDESGSSIVHIKQLAKSPGVEFLYKIPIVFHVLYNDINDSKQNTPYSHLEQILDSVNKLFRNAGPNSADLNVEFYLAKRDPMGNLLKEPGVERVHWHSATMNAPRFMNSTKKEDLALIWDPNKYVNVILYNFENSAILGISAFPLVPSDKPMKHLDQVASHTLDVSQLDKMRCVSLNSIHITDKKEDSPFMPSNPAATLAHELGHYLGLRHTFSEKGNILVGCQDSDGYMDTPTYDKQEYDRKVEYLLRRIQNDSIAKKEFSFSTLYERNACYGGGKFVSRNIMDYDYCHKNQFTQEQKEIVRHVLTYSPFIPGPKIIENSKLNDKQHAKNIVIPYTASNCPEIIEFPKF
ncbi:zinc-dependent metalloproteinase lipoprotein [Ornithobacterium rhinotracheale]|uniref:zinc-dependent metalloproteinase lipoprotein n=1 Tax=Ornithobacterium rhinotracheale TaxID=28251 RepID=UPI00129C4885|nr:zinc-dependent metalloproteinase lipoprotein [Ornithobacterium rhinotracheale]MRI62840.1 zinc-dependent metalloproteinase lipoprotein [Ornithobacterium rhinotracheale]